MPRRTKCKCGKEITTNTWKCHLKSNKCSLREEEKIHMLSILDLKTKNPRAFLVSDGESAKYDIRWFESIIKGNTDLKDWTLSCPRPRGVMTPEARKKISLERSGKGNPMFKSISFDFDKKDVEKYAKELFEKVINNKKLPVSYIQKKLSQKFPTWKYLWADSKYEQNKRGHNKTNQILAEILNISIEDLVVFYAKRRGEKIREGLLKSEKFLKKASEIGAGLFSRTRISTPQKILYEMILCHDPNAILEFKIPNKDRYKCFDIYSPKINALIEMHGRVFHDHTKTKKKLLEVVLKNIRNDEIKENLAKKMNMNYIVFWDDQTNDWDNKVKTIFNLEYLKETQTYEFNKNKILQSN